MHRFILLLLVIVFSLTSCKDTDVPVIEASDSKTLKEMRLGESNYYLNLPDSFKLEEARGKEGQLGYHIVPFDTAIGMFGFVEIQYGTPIGNTYRGGPGKLIAKSNLLNKEVEWILEDRLEGFMYAYTDEKGDFNANVSARTRNGIDSLISWISTLKTK
jgi:hypothetical protein